MRSLASVLFSMGVIALISVSEIPRDFSGLHPSKTFAADKNIDTQKEFPNYLHPDRVFGPKTADREALTLRLFERACANVLGRIEFPLLASTGEVKWEPYFKYVLKMKNASSGGPDTQLIASGGVLRAVIAFIYQEIWTTMHHPRNQKTIRQILEEIASGAIAIPPLEVRGLGADWDILLRGQSPSAVQQILNVTNNALRRFEEQANARTDARVTTLLLKADIRDYDEQMGLATRQGGSTLDFLAIDMESGSFVHPVAFPTIAKDLLYGLIDYIAPLDPTSVKNPFKQTTRGARPLIEVPFAKYKDSQRLKAELTTFRDALKSNPGLRYTYDGMKAIEQFKKMMLNSRMRAANNLLFRSPKGSVEALVLEISQLLSEKDDSLVKEFLDHFDIENRDPMKRGLGNLPRATLMNLEEFFAEHTDDGRIHHGSPSVESGISLLRGDLYVSSASQGTAWYGRGGYCSKHVSFSQRFAKSNGMTFQLYLTKSKNLNVVNLDDPKTVALLKPFFEKADALGMDPHAYLARYHNIDIIISTHILVQNSAAVSLWAGGEKQTHQSRAGIIFKTFVDQTKNKKLDSKNRIAALQAADGLNSVFAFQPQRTSLQWFLHYQAKEGPSSFVQRIAEVAAAEVLSLLEANPRATDINAWARDIYSALRQVVHDFKEPETGRREEALKNLIKLNSYLHVEKLPETPIAIVSHFLPLEGTSYFVKAYLRKAATELQGRIFQSANSQKAISDLRKLAEISSDGRQYLVSQFKNEPQFLNHLMISTAKDPQKTRGYFRQFIHDSLLASIQDGTDKPEAISAFILWQSLGIKSGALLKEFEIAVRARVTLYGKSKSLKVSDWYFLSVAAIMYPNILAWSPELKHWVEATKHVVNTVDRIPSPLSSAHAFFLAQLGFKKENLAHPSYAYELGKDFEGSSDDNPDFDRFKQMLRFTIQNKALAGPMVSYIFSVTRHEQYLSELLTYDLQRTMAVAYESIKQKGSIFMFAERLTPQHIDMLEKLANADSSEPSNAGVAVLKLKFLLKNSLSPAPQIQNLTKFILAEVKTSLTAFRTWGGYIGFFEAGLLTICEETPTAELNWKNPDLLEYFLAAHLSPTNMFDKTTAKRIYLDGRRSGLITDQMLIPYLKTYSQISPLEKIVLESESVPPAYLQEITQKAAHAAWEEHSYGVSANAYRLLLLGSRDPKLVKKIKEIAKDNSAYPSPTLQEALAFAKDLASDTDDEAVVCGDLATGKRSARNPRKKR